MQARTHFFAQGPQFFGVDIIPDAFHVVPVGDNAVFHGVFDLRGSHEGAQGISAKRFGVLCKPGVAFYLEQATKLLSFASYEQIAFYRSCHDAGVLWASDATATDEW